ncbi:phospho-sugar mutase [Isachenkonia alkalipeptolytica]|uniref:phosphoglucomutase (alpha-D-glucose-1,6-bisphosphate-dependent) n=1 Tax=Isachenkonia alkalipeptolytica TaxID=2565777 RepID=A0AA43XLD2_9CLOT|nr:phospho-sugar mutase [Isachenkonia alkalipeptolytica]NBG88384.1 phospho-sugar mutase [Isachenkonia alkalipeptolytica]
MENHVKKEYQAWLDSELVDGELKKELKEIQGQEAAIEDRFYTSLEFGTAGLRGVIGAGPNRMNNLTVRRTTKGLGLYIRGQGKEARDRGVAIAYDCRRKSPEFAKEAALVLSGMGIKTYLFEGLRTTPELSFALREKNCISGIVITASHNPPEYNGYKVYWEDGAQISSERAKGIIESIEKINTLEYTEIVEENAAIEQGILEYLGEKMDRAYLERVKQESVHQGIFPRAKDFAAVFTPLHGTASRPVETILKEQGLKNLHIVPEEQAPNGEFPTVKSPNPEDKEAFELALKLGQEKNADLIFGTDPDGDRVGAIVRNTDGETQLLSGNQIGALILYDLLATKKEKGELPENALMIKTIVTSEMGVDIAKNFGVATEDTLTGFKYIGERIKHYEQTGEKTYLFGYEESYGYLAGTYVRDKDAVVASMLLTEMAAYYKTKGKNLVDVLEMLYEEYGYYQEDLHSIKLEGKEGLEKIQKVLETFRKEGLQQVGGKKVLKTVDYAADDTGLPRANVVKFFLEDDAWMVLRPSGTEPKLKIYGGVKENSLKESRKTLKHIMDGTREMVEDNL